MGHRRILSLGEICWDQCWVVDELPKFGPDCHLLLERGSPGGSALNTACVLHSLGAPVTLSGNSVGTDKTGHDVIGYLRGRGMDFHLERGPFEKTSVCHVFVERSNGRRAFRLDYPHIQEYDPRVLDRVLRDTAEGAYSHAFVQPFIRGMAEHFFRALEESSRPWILIQDVAPSSEFIGHADAVQISFDEGLEFVERSVEDVARRYFANGRIRTLFITAGERGVAWCEKERRPEFFPAQRAKEAVDMTGCGDAFRAGLLKALFDGADIPAAIACGQSAGAHKAAILGSHF